MKSPRVVKVAFDKEKQPIFWAVLKPKSVGSEELLGKSLAELCTKDPSFGSSGRPAENPLAVSLSGELQLELLIEKLKDHFQVEAEVERLNVIYLEPVLRVHINVPERFSSAVTKELDGRGAWIDAHLPWITAYARPKEMLGFRDFLGVLTGFKDTFYSVQLAHYRETVELG